MAVAALLILVAGLVRGAALSSAKRAKTHQPTSDWKYFPPGAKVGIVTGGTPDLYGKANFASTTAAVMLKYAKRHGYAFFVDKNMGRLSARAKGWNKIMLLHKLLREVQTLVWMDADILLTDTAKPIEKLFNVSQCDGTEQRRWSPFLPRKTSNSTFLWMNADVSPARYLVNANTAMIGVQQSPAAFNFLEKVWKVGDDPNHFLHHSDPMRWAKTSKIGFEKKDGDVGWPYEQGAVWDVLASDPDGFMRGTCITPETHMHSVRGYKWNNGMFARHLSGMPNDLRKSEARKQLQRLGGKAEIK